MFLAIITLFACEQKDDSEINIVASFTFSPSNALAPATISFTNSCQGALEYSWDFDDGETSEEANPVHEFLEAGDYEVTLTAKNADRFAEVTKTVTVGEPMPVAEFNIENNNLPAPATVTFINNSQNGQSCLWNFGDGSTSTAENPEHTYTVPGSFTVSLTVTNSSGSDTEEQTVVVLESANIIPGNSIGVYLLGDTWGSIVSKTSEDNYWHSVLYIGGYYYHLCEFEETGVSFFFRTTGSSLLSSTVSLVISAFEPFEGYTAKGITFGSTVEEVIVQYGQPDDESYSTIYYDALGIDFSYDDNREKIEEISIYEPDSKKSTYSFPEIAKSMKDQTGNRMSVN